MWPEKIKRQLFYWFGFSRREAEGFFTLLVLMLVAMLAPLIVNYLTANTQNTDELRITTVEAQAIEQISLRRSKPNHRYVASPQSQALKPVAFDPNTISEEAMLAMGIKPSLAKRWINYRNKGGRFRIKNDVAKLYGLTAENFELLRPYILLPDSLTQIDNSKLASALPQPKPRYKAEKPKFDLNKADSAQLIEIFGIGQALSRRIIRYRERLGGFISYEQLYEVYALDTPVVAQLVQRSYISPDFKPRKVLINRLSDSNLSDHPYLGKKLSRILVNYKTHHGMYMRPEDLLKTSLITPEKLEKLIPYLDFSE